MEIVKLFIRGEKKGVYAITKKDEVTDALLDILNDGIECPNYTKEVLASHLENGLALIPKDEKSFYWDENIHGKFFD